MRWPLRPDGPPGALKHTTPKLSPDHRQNHNYQYKEKHALIVLILYNQALYL